MNRSPAGRYSLLFLFTVLLLLLSSAGTSLARDDAAPGTQRAELFTAVPDEAAPAAETIQWPAYVTRHRFVSVRFDLLSPQISALRMNLFDDVTVEVTFTALDPALEGGYVLHGYVTGQAETSAVSLSIFDDTLQGNIRVNDASYQVRTLRNGLHTIQQVDTAEYPDEGEPVSATTSNTPENGVTLPPDADGVDSLTPDRPIVITLMVVYTDDAVAAAGGTAAMYNLINLAISETNIGYSNSGINQRLVLVRRGEVNYNEPVPANIELARDQLTNPNDGILDGIHSWRDSAAADVVAMFTGTGDACGMAHIMENVSLAFAAWAFSVVRWDCATGNYSLAHELGHIMGARHDSAMDPNNTPYPYSHGWVNVPDQWRTIMAYNNQCVAAGTTCARINYWSNPDRTYGGDPMGDSPSANNVRALNNTASTVAAFRNSDRQFGTIGDIDDDGRTDVFNIGSSGWRYSSAAASAWQQTGISSERPLEDFQFGDFDGDGEMDVFNIGGGGWRISYGATSPWQQTGISSERPLEDLRFGDFNGDGRTDVFNIGSSGWRISYGATSPWQQTGMASSESITRLRFGDFDGDGRTDVFRVLGNAWMVSYAAEQTWVNTGISSERPLEDLRFGDFDGDGRTDIFNIGSSGWRISYGATSPWRPTGISSERPLEDLRFGDFNGDGSADVFNIGSSGWRVSYGAMTPWQPTGIASERPLDDFRFGYVPDEYLEPPAPPATPTVPVIPSPTQPGIPAPTRTPGPAGNLKLYLPVIRG